MSSAHRADTSGGGEGGRAQAGGTVMHYGLLERKARPAALRERLAHHTHARRPLAEPQRARV